ncbi:MAG: DinB family protein [Nitrospinae bacterium]|nr:DinB family protein [Nitrospinota bacterium]
MNALEKYSAVEGQLEQTVQALEGIGQEEFDWKPVQHEKVRTIGDMMRHLVSAEDTFINRFVLGKDVQARTPQTHRTPESLIADFQALRGQTLALMRRWDENDLQKSYAGPRGMQMTLDRILQIIIGHEIGHRSQMLLMRRWKNPDR